MPCRGLAVRQGKGCVGLPNSVLNMHLKWMSVRCVLQPKYGYEKEYKSEDKYYKAPEYSYKPKY